MNYLFSYLIETTGNITVTEIFEYSSECLIFNVDRTNN